MVLFHATLLEFASKDQLKLGFSKKLEDIQTSSDLVWTVLPVVELDVLGAVKIISY